MKLLVAVGILCCLVVVSSRKTEETPDNLAEPDSELHHISVSREHHIKKYDKGHQRHHYHKKSQKSFDIPEQKSKKLHSMKEMKDAKNVPKVAAYDIPVEEAELQADIRLDKKKVWDKAREDYHLQDLAYEQSREQKSHGKSPHQFQRGHHKKGHHFSNHKASKTSKNEEKLFEEHVPKEHVHLPILEDSFETLEKSHHQKAKKSSKKYQKKAYEGKKDKKHKKEKKNKKNEKV